MVKHVIEFISQLWKMVTKAFSSLRLKIMTPSRRKMSQMMTIKYQRKL